MKKNNKFTLRRLIATLGMVLMLSLSLTGMTQPANALPSVVSAATSIGVSTDLLYFNHYLTSATVTLSGGSSYAATPSASWIHPNVSGNKLTIYVDYLDGTSSRAGTVRVKSGSSEKVVYVIQYPRIRAYASSSSSTEISSITIPGVQNKIKPVDTTITVRSIGKTLTATPQSPWLSVRVSGSSVVITANPNTSLAERRGSVVLSNGYETKTITVIQKKIVLDKITTYPYMGPNTFSLTTRLKNAFKAIKKSSWSSLSGNEQWKLLDSFCKETYAYYGLAVAGISVYCYYDSCYKLNTTYKDLLSKNPITVKEDGRTMVDEDGNIHVFFVYNNLKGSYQTAVETVLHEFRHAYQLRYAAYDSTMFCYLCFYNWTHYISDNESDYKAQFIEKDAFTYSEKLFSALDNAVE